MPRGRGDINRVTQVLAGLQSFQIPKRSFVAISKWINCPSLLLILKHSSGNLKKMTNVENPYHQRLKAHPILAASVGVIHTLLTAGVVFGWASLLPMLRSEGIDLSPTEFARIFTHGAIGNYLS